jgi:hypothetical protein
MNPFAPLLAAGNGDLIKIAVIALIVIISVIGQLLAKMRQVRPPGGGPPPPRPVPADVADEIGEFLRRAAQRRGAGGRQPAGTKQPPPLAEQPPPLRAEQPVQAELVAAAPVGGQVDEHVQKYLDEQDFSRRGDELGKDVAHVDKEVDQHLQQVFSHPVSKLEAVPGEAAAPPVAYEPPDLVGASAEIPATFATGLLDLVSSPDSLRQAIILSEILHRPEDRWG